MTSTRLDDLALRIFRLGLRLVRSERSLGTPRGTLRIPKLSALATVVDQQSVAVDKLAKAEGVREPTISATLQVLEAGELVTLDRTDEDKRVRNAKPTERAERQLKKGKRRLAAVLHDAGVGEAECAKLEEAVATIHAVLRSFQDVQEERQRKRVRRRTVRQGRS